MRRAQQGFTLVEMMVSVTILALLTVVMAGTFLVGLRAIGNEARVIAADTAVSEASLWLTRDLNSEATTLGCPCTIQAGSPPMALMYGVPPGTPVVYSIDASQNLIRNVNGTDHVAARGVTRVSISWVGCYGTVSILPSATSSVAVTLNVSNRPGGCI
ncbi:MAG: prepilin-type N-terminal cleavage/methylation domain-containing protein [Chloroflexota bacterium]|nr:MAG: prepilin-type N-terminal cleavage/methylation domain-containing protein [Chloroflexota bacterium]TMD86865.1 MAG: prepilin-type N-terminal cleavage/methylation domain-containing protein [Chloroflexota bacterium]